MNKKGGRWWRIVAVVGSGYLFLLSLSAEIEVSISFEGLNPWLMFDLEESQGEAADVEFL